MGRFISVFQILLYLMLQYQVSCLLSLSTLPSTNHFCPHDERHVLLQFKQYFSINSSASSFCGETSYPKTVSWNENSSNCCSWDGVTCDGRTGHVIELDLACSQLYGTIHPNNSLFQLSHLQLLDLSLNDFNYSHISSGIGHFPSLTHLELSFSKFSGSIPSKISHLSKLVSLGISSGDAGLLRLEPHNFRMLLKNLTQLQELALLQVNISSSLPNCLMNLSSLRTLYLPFTTLHGDLPHEILLLPNLQELELSGNDDLTGVFPMVNWSSGSNLRMLHLGLTNLSGEVPDSIGHLKSLFSLGLSHCNFFGSIPKSLGNLTQITYLDLSWNNFNGQVPSTISNLKQLISLILAFNNLDGTIPDGFVLNLSMNHLVGPIPRGYQFDTFQNDSYVGNVGLCGLPLSKECGDSEAKHQPPLVFQEEGDTIFLGGFTWKAVAMGYGCGMVLGLVMGYVMFLIGRPKWFARIVKGERHRNVKSIKQIGYQGGMGRNQQT